MTMQGKATLLWLDGHTAKIFEFAGEEVEHRVYHRHDHEPAPSNTLKADRQADAFFHQVAAHLQSAGDFILLGPGEAKHQFINHLEHHRHAALARHLRTVDSTDHPTDPQLVALGREYFAQHPLRD